MMADESKSSPGHGSKLPRRGEAAIAALLSERTIGDAARASGISQATLCRWLVDEGFAAAYADARRAAYGQAIAQLQQASAKAVRTLVDLLDDYEAPAAARVTAARTILDKAAQAVEVEDISRRLGALEVEAEAHRAAEQRRRGRR